MIAVFDADQLGCNVYAAAELAHAAFEHRVNIKLFADGSDVDILVREAERRRACGDFQTRDVR